MAAPQPHLLQPARGGDFDPAVGHPCKAVHGQLALQGAIGPGREELVRLQHHAHAQRQRALATALHAGRDIEHVARARARRHPHPAAVFAGRCLAAGRAGRAALARLAVPLAGRAFDRGRDPGEQETLPDAASATAYAARGRLQLQAAAFAVGAVFDHLAPHFPDAAGHHVL